MRDLFSWFINFLRANIPKEVMPDTRTKNKEIENKIGTKKPVVGLIKRRMAPKEAADIRPTDAKIACKIPVFTPLTLAVLG